MAISFAQVVYLTDKVTKIIPVAYIRYNRKDKDHIKPRDEKDFDEEHEYYARWYDCNTSGIKCDSKHEHVYSTHRVKLFHLAESEAAAEHKSQNEEKRKRFKPKKLQNTSSSDTSESRRRVLPKSKKAIDSGVVGPKSKEIVRKFNVNQFLAQRKPLKEISNVLPSYKKLNNHTTASRLFCNNCEYSCAKKKELIHHMTCHITDTVDAETAENHVSAIPVDRSVETVGLAPRRVRRRISDAFSDAIVPAPITENNVCNQPTPLTSSTNSQSRELNLSASKHVEGNDVVDDSSGDEEDRHPIRGGRTLSNRMQRETTPDVQAEPVNNATQRVSRSRRRRFQPTTRAVDATNSDYGYGIEIIGKEVPRYSMYIKEYKEEIYRDIKKWREVRSLSPEGRRISLFLVRDDQIYLGCGIWYDKALWLTTIDREELKFLADLVHIFWPIETIRNRCLLVEKTKNSIPNSPRLVPVTPAKLNGYFRVYRRWLNDRQVPQSLWGARMNKATYVWTRISSRARTAEMNRRLGYET